MSFLKSVQAGCRPVASWSASSESLHPDVIESKWNLDVKRLLKSVQAECRPAACWRATSKNLHPDVIKSKCNQTLIQM